ncbi:hypothetical protein [Deinococcus kurensis]|uniref:hypothetical protein n=1 Tax=Deinococcus kurensis TaxID=2662757 RepID=UPI0012D2A3C5|nr:hypothetical protein [Deinococcus kurensis]
MTRAPSGARVQDLGLHTRRLLSDLQRGPVPLDRYRVGEVDRLIGHGCRVVHLPLYPGHTPVPHLTLPAPTPEEDPVNTPMTPAPTRPPLSAAVGL